MKRVVVVLINYFKEEQLVAFVCKQLLQQKGVVLHVIVVDNGSHKPEKLQTLEQFGVTVKSPGSNLGYFGAAQCAWVSEATQGFNPDYFVVSNFDLHFETETFFKNYFEAEERQSSYVSGPAITSELHRSELNPMYRTRLTPARMRRLLWVTSFYPFFFVYQLLHHVKRSLSGSKSDVKRGDESTYAIHGSMMFFSKKFFEKGGSLQFNSFLYGEELFVAEQVLKMKNQCVVHHDLRVMHEEHSTTGNIKGRKHMLFLNQSLKYIYKEFYA